MKKYINRTIKVIVFMLIFCISFEYSFGVRGVMKMGTDVTNVSYYNTFYDLPKNCIDGIVLGNSVAHRGWCDVTAWNESGMAVYSLASESQPVPLMKYIIKEARKTQDIKFVVIDIHGMRSNVFYFPSETFIRRVTDIMPMSANRVDTVNAAYDYFNKIAKSKENVLKKRKIKTADLEKDALLFPFMKYHARWQDLTRDDFIDCTSQVMSTYTGWHMCEISKMDIAAAEAEKPNKFGYTDEAGGLTEYQIESFTDLLDYLKKEDIPAVFVSFPTKATKAEQMQLNQTIDIINNFDYDKFSVVNMNTKDVYYQEDTGLNAELKIDWKNDFYGKDHVNSYGSEKTTKYLMNHILERFDIKDKRGEKAYKTWDKAYDNYVKLMQAGWEKVEETSPEYYDHRTGGWDDSTWRQYMEEILNSK